LAQDLGYQTLTVPSFFAALVANPGAVFSSCNAVEFLFVADAS